MNANTFTMYSNMNTLHFSQKYEYEYFYKCIRILMNTNMNTFWPGLITLQSSLRLHQSFMYSE